MQKRESEYVQRKRREKEQSYRQLTHNISLKSNLKKNKERLAKITKKNSVSPIYRSICFCFSSCKMLHCCSSVFLSILLIFLLCLSE